MKTAIIGAGISGISAAYGLHPQHQITVYEQANYVGGHSRTLSIKTPDGQVAVDTGFIVFNRRNYPHLSALFKQLNVPVAKSRMSFGVSINDGWLEYGTQHLSCLWAQHRNVLRGAFWRMLYDIHHFNRSAKIYVADHPHASLGQCLDDLRLGYWFRQYYLLAMAGAIWSTTHTQLFNFPAKTLVQFFDNHGLLTINDQPQWYTVVGGSQEYVRRLTTGFTERIRQNCDVKSVRRTSEGVVVTDHQGHSETYDQVVLACHSDQALNMLENPTTTETEILGNVHYQSNRVVLHRDTSFMPKRKKAWSSWVYLSTPRSKSGQQASLSYWMNNLQPLETQTPVLVTLNPSTEPDANLVYNSHQFDHPVFDEAAITAQSRVSEIQGQDRLWFCGAWQRYGFHEDGIDSTARMLNAMGIQIPWQ